MELSVVMKLIEIHQERVPSHMPGKEGSRRGAQAGNRVTGTALGKGPEGRGGHQAGQDLAVCPDSKGCQQHPGL